MIVRRHVYFHRSFVVKATHQSGHVKGFLKFPKSFWQTYDNFSSPAKVFTRADMAGTIKIEWAQKMWSKVNQNAPRSTLNNKSWSIFTFPEN